ncbi:aKG-HExxH-type peptide beta-hydroxylase [Nostoc sp.]|uniref:aKG-HExxH-type peptide beta-hydroxylase n=1 Tax=Nostoc sp. TaxID=1180 RepID=UPI002FFD22E7
MFYLIGQQKNIETVVTLSYKQLLNEKTQDVIGLKRAYRNFLKNIQVANSIPEHDSLNVTFASEPSVINNLIQLYKVESALNDKNQTTAIINQNPEESLEYISKALKKCESEFIKLKTIYPEKANLFELVINYVFCAPSNVAGGGSISNSIGIIWASPRPNWQSEDFVEFYTHEFTHNLVFLDERRYQHYVDYDLILDPDNFCKSAILCTPRPLDKVFHSLLVATEVLLLREDSLGHPNNPKIHPPSETILKNCFDTIHSIERIQTKSQLLTRRGLELMNLCRDKLNIINNSLTKKEYILLSS